ncbi:MAG: D-alanyl-D-alanine carboxypeptidase family protein, partial [Fimbriimonadaceae bacterium]
MVRALKSWMIATAIWGGGAAAIAQANEYPLITPEFGPKHTAQSLLIMDMKTGQVLYEYKADTRRFPASTTKIMTTMLALDYLQPEDVLSAPADIKKVEGSSMFLQPGERVSVRDLCHAMMLRSANDACVVIANRIGGSLPGFARI